MANLFSLVILLILSSSSSSLLCTTAQPLKSGHLLDLVVKDYTFRSFDIHFRTGTLHSVDLPANLSGVRVDSARFRCGSLTRYGARIKEFHVGAGVVVHPCVERVLIVKQEIDTNWSSIYYDNYGLDGYRFITPILGLLAYNADNKLNTTNSYELQIVAARKPITVDFSNITRLQSKSQDMALCASIDNGGKVTLGKQVAPNVCAVKREGHFGIVIESPPAGSRRKVNLWKVVVGCAGGAAVGVFLLGLLVVAMFVKAKRRAKMEEMERRAYEEEALQVSVVGHVRALTAAGTRTLPTIEHEYTPPPH